jgi:8-oxo-dGTP diphosphatase
MELNAFNLRIYGLLLQKDKVLITHERRGGVQMTKFPGGGLEFGEGINACLMREFMEEIEIDIEVKEFFYVNDFLQVSAFRKSDQLLSFYYFVQTAHPELIKVEEFRALEKEEQVFEWILISELDIEKFTFPIDRKVVEMLKEGV